MTRHIHSFTAPDFYQPSSSSSSERERIEKCTLKQNMLLFINSCVHGNFHECKCGKLTDSFQCKCRGNPLSGNQKHVNEQGFFFLSFFHSILNCNRFFILFPFFCISVAVDSQMSRSILEGGLKLQFATFNKNLLVHLS